MQKAIFLDRDGIIIRERGDYNYKDEDIEVVEGIAEALQAMKQKGYVFIVITNQGGIAKRLYSHSRLKEIHGRIKEFLSSFGVRIIDFYYCPHHPSLSECLCRKPDSLMLERAMAKHSIEKEDSWFIGDNERDIEAGKKAGVKTLLIPSNADLRNFIDQIN
jgi:D-glycero-D-manno-heptose 1,7-bisphosphate phosphatase